MPADTPLMRPSKLLVRVGGSPIPSHLYSGLLSSFLAPRHTNGRGSTWAIDHQQARAELGHAHTVMLDPSIWTMVIVYPDRASCWTLDRPASSSGVRLCARADRAADLEARVRAVRPQLYLSDSTRLRVLVQSSDMRTPVLPVLASAFSSGTCA